MDRENQVGDYLFTNKTDAEQARIEEEKIRKLKEKLRNGYDINLLYNLYNKCLEARTFRTPVGFDFLKDMRNTLIDSPDIDEDILPVPLYTTFEHSADISLEKTVKYREEMRKANIKSMKDKNSTRFKWSLFVNVVLIIVVGIMFYITTTSNNPNILNYENAILNKYSQWSEELKEREENVREKEMKLGIEYNQSEE